MRELLIAAVRKLPPRLTAAALLGMQVAILYQVDSLDRRMAALELRAARTPAAGLPLCPPAACTGADSTHAGR